MRSFCARLVREHVVALSVCRGFCIMKHARRRGSSRDWLDTSEQQHQVAPGVVGRDGVHWNLQRWRYVEWFSSECDTGCLFHQVMITTVQPNEHDDPLENNFQACGYERCGGFGDFNDIIVDQHGRVWFGLAHNVAGEIGSSAPWPRAEPKGYGGIGSHSTRWKLDLVSLG